MFPVSAEIATLRFAPAVRSCLAGGPQRIMVTGAGGWLGQATLEMLEDALGDSFDQRVTAYASASRDHVMRSGRRIRLLALSQLADHPATPQETCIAHYAFLTRERVVGVGHESYVSENRALTAFITTQARRLEAAGTFSTSSGAVYRRDRTLDHDLAANPYGALKFEEEGAFAALGPLGTRVAICRVFNVAGPFINKDYALGSLIQSALHEPVVTIRARHRVIRSYAHVRDIISAGFAIMTGLVPAPRAPYDTAGAESLEVGALAARVLKVSRQPDKPIVRGAFIDAPDDCYVGDGTIFAALARQMTIGLIPLDEQIMDTARYLAAFDGLRCV